MKMCIRDRATFVLANGAAATGQKVTVFFTFWGLNVLKKVQKPKVKKDIFGKMFGMMLPSSSLKLKLSKMNMFGMGSRMMRFLMKQKGVDSLESLRSQALAQGVESVSYTHLIREGKVYIVCKLRSTLLYWWRD